MKIKSYSGWCVTCSLAITILILSLLDAADLTSLYLFVGKVIFIDPQIIAKHFEQISNYGHTLAAFILTLLTLPLLKRPLLIAIPALTIFVVCGEGLQYFSPSRNSKIEDIFYNLIGIALATTLFFIFKKTFSPEALSRDESYMKN